MPEDRYDREVEARALRGFTDLYRCLARQGGFRVRIYLRFPSRKSYTGSGGCELFHAGISFIKRASDALMCREQSITARGQIVLNLQKSVTERLACGFSNPLMFALSTILSSHIFGKLEASIDELG